MRGSLENALTMAIWTSSDRSGPKRDCVNGN
jgi:hypothetical protein